MGAQAGKGHDHGAGKEEPYAGKKELGARVRCADGEQLVAKLDARKGTAPKQTADDAQQQGSPRGPEDGGDPWLGGARCDVVRRHAFDAPSRFLAVLPRAYPIAETGLAPQLMSGGGKSCARGGVIGGLRSPVRMQNALFRERPSAECVFP